jgi:hypothetical protein
MSKNAPSGHGYSKGGDSSNSALLSRCRRIPVGAIALLSILLSNAATTQMIYKWVDERGQVHYGQNKPSATTPAIPLDIAPPPPSTPETSATAEIARINALAEQMARERQASEQARAAQALQSLERENEELQNELLKQQLQPSPARNPDHEGGVPFYPYPYYPPGPVYPPYRPHPPGPPWSGPCQSGPACQQYSPPPPPTTPPKIKPHPPFQPRPAGLAPTGRGGFQGR